MDNYTTSSPQEGTFHPPFTRSNTSSTTLYFEAMPSLGSLFNKPRVQSRSSSPERGIKSAINAPVPTDPVQNQRPIPINGHTNMGYGQGDKATLKAGGSTHGDDGPTSDAPQQSSPVKVKAGGAVGISRQGNDSPAHDAPSPSSSHKRSLSRSDDRHGGATDEKSLRSLPIVYQNTIPEGEDFVSNRSQTGVSQKVSIKRSPSKLVKRRSTKGKQAEHLVNGGSRRSVSRTSQRSFRSSRGPVFDMVTAPPNATLSDAGGAFGTGAVMAAPENEVEEELQSEFQERLTTAERSLTKKQTTKIHKEECAFIRLMLVYPLISYEFSFLSRSGGVKENIKDRRFGRED